ncbi:MAG TPA: hypothetical protein VF794_29935 [Archangium sp.]|uniref:hypothetical protein n=1 Tax=Archangium sp. TaxID=1872627 RepID=UPI002EDB326B
MSWQESSTNRRSCRVTGPASSEPGRARRAHSSCNSPRSPSAVGKRRAGSLASAVARRDSTSRGTSGLRARTGGIASSDITRSRSCGRVTRGKGSSPVSIS